MYRIYDAQCEWQKALDWLTKKIGNKEDESVEVFVQAQQFILHLPWSAELVVRSSPGYKEVLAAYLSSQWLADTHIEQLYIVLSKQLTECGLSNIYLMLPTSFAKLTQIYRTNRTVRATPDTGNNLARRGSEDVYKRY